jgi:peptidoglycan/xylan/chitin deacetylase (PgdA/CDA1 family)
MRTQVCITIDTEFSIGGAFADPVRRRPIGEENVTCPAQGRENGLGFLLDTFAEHGLGATFFVEALQSAYFGDAPMGRMVERLLKAGQDVQLHIHPCWLAFQDPQWAERLSPQQPPDDRCDGRTEAEMAGMIEAGIAALRRIGVPEMIAMRTGNLRADRTVYRAMNSCGLAIASNIGVGLWRPDDETLRLAGGRRWIEGVLEVPVLSYRQPALGSGRSERLFTTTAASWKESESLLWQARRAGVPTVVLLTHPFEFVKGDRLEPAQQRSNRINQRRLQRMCAFLARHPEEFETTSFAAAAPGWLVGGDVPEPELRAPLVPVLARMAENKANDLVRAL